MTQRIAILIQYFGPWPEWMNFFIESCRANRTVDWIIFGDSPAPENRARNVRHVQTSFEDYKRLLSNALCVSLDKAEPYKLCDLKPALGHVHRDLIRDYDFIGFGDLDVVYGDIRAFYDDVSLARYDLLSTHRDRVSGHFCLMRNSAEMVEAFRLVPGWEGVFGASKYMGFDEGAFFNLFRNSPRRLFERRVQTRAHCQFREAYTTPGPTNRMRWYWRDGRLANEFYPMHPMLYLHFMSWHSNRWFDGVPNVAAGAAAPWSKLEKVVQIDWRAARKQGFMISPSGIQAIEPVLYP